MVIRRNEQWGERSVADASWPILPGDAALALHVPVVPARLSGGNLHRALGQPSVRSEGEECTLVPVDVLECAVREGMSTRTLVAAADITVGRWLSRDRFVVLTNGGILGGLNLAPRAHPNDGEWDSMVMSGSMSVRDRISARRRARTGTHVPHPCLHLARFTSMTLLNDGHLCLVIDGRDAGRWDSVSLRVVPDARTVCV